MIGADSAPTREAVSALLAALEPFADIVADDEGSEDYGDETKVVVTFGRTTHYALTLGDLRRARDVHYEHTMGEK